MEFFILISIILLIFVSSYREFVSSLANCIVEIKDQSLNLFRGTYDEYLASQMNAEQLATVH